MKEDFCDINLDGSLEGSEAEEELPAADRDGGSEQTEIIGVTFKNAGKIYYFDASGNSASVGKHVIVDTARGWEYGRVALSNRMVSNKDLVQPLRKVIRVADRDDDDRYRANCEKEDEAFEIGLKKIAEHHLSMKLIDVEYTFDNAKLLFYFTSAERVDFRELVKDLASVFRTRIELRQIGLRDETKIMGGFGICGRECCCHSFLGDFVQVSIKMAKEQNLSLNTSKISGICGRLMCCLRYEHDVYQESLKQMPKVDSKVITPDGEGVVAEVQPLSGLVKVRSEKDGDSKIIVYDVALIKDTDGKPYCGEEETESRREIERRRSARVASAHKQRADTQPETCAEEIKKSPVEPSSQTREEAEKEHGGGQKSAGKNNRRRKQNKQKQRGEVESKYVKGQPQDNRNKQVKPEKTDKTEKTDKSEKQEKEESTEGRQTRTKRHKQHNQPKSGNQTNQTNQTNQNKQQNKSKQGEQEKREKPEQTGAPKDQGAAAKNNSRKNRYNKYRRHGNKNQGGGDQGGSDK